VQSHEYSIFSNAKTFTEIPYSCSKNALKLTYSNVEFQNCLGSTPVSPASRGGEWRGGRPRRAKVINGSDGEVEGRRGAAQCPPIDF